MDTSGEEQPQSAVRPEEGGLGGDTEDMSGEAVSVKRRHKWTEPSKKEIEEHMVTHLPFREWCPRCVKGKSVSRPHRQATGDSDL